MSGVDKAILAELGRPLVLGCELGRIVEDGAREFRVHLQGIGASRGGAARAQLGRWLAVPAICLVGIDSDHDLAECGSFRV